MKALRFLTGPRGGVFLLVVLLLIVVTIYQPSFAEPGQFMRYIRDVAPVAIVAIGQYFVIANGHFDLSQGSIVTMQVIVAGNLVGQNPDRSVPVLALMLVLGLAIGLVNGVLTTMLKVPSFIVTLGMMLALRGVVLWWTGGAATGNPADEFRAIGRSGIQNVPLLDFVPWPVFILAGWLVVGIWLMRRPFGKVLIAMGDNAAVTRYAGARDWWTTTRAFIISALAASTAGVILVGYSGVHPSVGLGYEFQAITAVVLGGVVLGGGRGWIVAAAAGAFALEALFKVLNFVGVDSALRDGVQGAIIIAAVAYAGLSFGRRRRGGTSHVTSRAYPGGTQPPAPVDGDAGATENRGN
jgi:ribose transport system permease protein